MQRVCGTYIWMQHKLRGEIGKPRTPVLKRVLFPNNSSKWQYSKWQYSKWQYSKWQYNIVGQDVAA